MNTNKAIMFGSVVLEIKMIVIMFLASYENSVRVEKKGKIQTCLYKNSMQTYSLEINKGYVTIGMHSMFCNWWPLIE